jgi:hypothetical protein
MTVGRRLCICARCSKEKLNFGFGMCSACLRRTKRETKPSFYLGTCYSELSRRVKTFDPLRPNYYGLPKCSKEEFVNRFLTDPEFLKQYEVWQKSGYQRKCAPSIDRINNKAGYMLDNLQFISQSENSRKDVITSTTLIKDGECKTFSSRKEAAEFLKIRQAVLYHHIKHKTPIKGYRIL